MHHGNIFNRRKNKIKVFPISMSLRQRSQIWGHVFTNYNHPLVCNDVLMGSVTFFSPDYYKGFTYSAFPHDGEFLLDHFT